MELLFVSSAKRNICKAVKSNIKSCLLEFISLMVVYINIYFITMPKEQRV